MGKAKAKSEARRVERVKEIEFRRAKDQDPKKKAKNGK